MTIKCFTTKISLCSRFLFRHTFGVHGIYIINYLLFMFFFPIAGHALLCPGHSVGSMRR